MTAQSNQPYTIEDHCMAYRSFPDRHFPPKEEEVAGESIKLIPKEEEKDRTACIDFINRQFSSGKGNEIEFPRGDFGRDDMIYVILRHYLTETEVKRIEELVEILKTGSTPDISEESLPVVYAIANLYHWKTMEEEIDGIIHCIDGANGTVHSSNIPEEILENFDLWDTECQVLLADVDLGNEWPQIMEYAMAEIMGYRNKYGFNFQSRDIIIYDTPRESNFMKTFQIYLDYWRK